MSKIDIVIPWLNPTDKWYEQYKLYCENENPGRIRDLNTIKYVLRSIEKNCTWLNKLYLVVFDEEQIPNWLNKDCNKLKIIYHKDIIPEEFLPNFNSTIVEMFIHKIPDISDNVIFVNDDMWFMKNIPAEMYFENDRPVHQYTIKNGKFNYRACMWDFILANTYELYHKITGAYHLFDTRHMPMPVNMNMQKFVWYKHENEILNSCKNAKIRKSHSLSNQLFYYLDEFNKHAINKPIYKTFICKAIGLNDKTKYNDIENLIKSSHIVCLNDNETLTKRNEDNVRKWIDELGQKYFPNKSIFEV